MTPAAKRRRAAKILRQIRTLREIEEALRDELFALTYEWSKK